MITSDDTLAGAARGEVADALVGRHLELAALEAQWSAVCLGDPRVVLIEGASGIGKTALVERFLARVRDAAVLRVSGDESETVVAMGVADQLLRLAGEPALLVPAAAAESERGRIDHVSVGNLILNALDRLQSAGPIVVALDDAQWADAPSLAALLFAVRRMELDRVLLIVTTRDDEELWIPEGLRRAAAGRAGQTLRLEQLDLAQLGELASALGVDLPAHALRELWGHTEGNPLHARALLHELPARVWLDGDALPAPRSFSALIWRRLARCSPPCRALAEAAAVLGPGCSLADAAGLAELADPLSALDEAVHAGLLSERAHSGARSLSFTHPLVRAAVYAGLGPRRRTALHVGAARLAQHPGAALRHRARAASGPDADLAAEIEAFARREAARGMWASAAETYRSASALSVGAQEREQRLLRALEAMIGAGQIERARRLASDIERFAPTALLYAVRANLAFLSARPQDAQPLFEQAWRLCDPRADPALAAAIAQRCALHWFLRLDAEQAVAWSARALALDSDEGTAVCEAHGVHAVALAHLGRFEEAQRTLEPALAHDGDIGVALATHRGWLALMRDDVDGAIADLTVAGPAALRCGLLNLAAVAFTVLARAEYAAGAWDDAVMHSQRAIAIAIEHEHALPAFVWGAAISVPAARGEWATADACILEATRKVIQCPDRTAWIGVTRALPAAARGDSRAVLDALAPLTTITPRAGLDEPGFWPWQDLYAEALVAAGRLPEAGDFLARHEAIAAARGRHSLLAKLARVRGRLHAAAGEPALAQRAFTRALEHCERAPMPYERALIELDLGSQLRRAGQRGAAAAHLQAARGTLEALGARPALERCVRELAGCGLAPGRRNGTQRSWLTPPERSVARLVAAGASNRDVAAELMVSVKTVEFHLTRIYARLGVRTRGQLAALVASGADARLSGEDLQAP